MPRKESTEGSVESPGTFPVTGTLRALVIIPPGVCRNPIYLGREGLLMVSLAQIYSNLLRKTKGYIVGRHRFFHQPRRQRCSLQSRGDMSLIVEDGNSLWTVVPQSVLLRNNSRQTPIIFLLLTSSSNGKDIWNVYNRHKSERQNKSIFCKINNKGNTLPVFRTI